MYNILYSPLLFNILDSVFGFISSFFVSLGNYVQRMVFSAVSIVLYGIGVALMMIVDVFQDFFMKLAGLQPHYINGIQSDEDILFTFLGDKNVLNVLLGMGIVAFFMVIIATIIQIIRSEYTSEGAKNTKGNIIGLTFKSFIMFLTVPVVSVLGIYVSNSLLQAVNAAFGSGTSMYVGGAVFRASSAGANRLILANKDIASEGTFDEWPDLADALNALSPNKVLNSTKDGILPGADNGGKFTSNKIGPDAILEIANAIDNAFANKEANANYQSSESNALFKNFSNFDYRNPLMVGAYYDLVEINYITMYLSAIFASYIFILASFGLIMRIYKIVLLFIISPPIIALTPLDGGKSYQQWRTNFLGAVISAYGVIVGLNAFFLVIKIFDQSKITFYPSAGLEGYMTREVNYIIYLVFILVGLFMIKDMSKIVSSLIGSGDSDALGAGTGMAKQVGKTAAMVGGGAIKLGTNWAARSFAKSQMAKLDSAAEGYGKEADDYIAQGGSEDDQKYKDLKKEQHKSQTQSYLFNERKSALEKQGLKGTVGDWVLKKAGSKESRKDIGDKFKPKHFSDLDKAQDDKEKMEETFKSQEGTKSEAYRRIINESSKEANGFIDKQISENKGKVGEKQVDSAKVVESKSKVANDIAQSYAKNGGFGEDGKLAMLGGGKMDASSAIEAMSQYQDTVKNELAENDQTNDLLRLINETLKTLQKGSALSGQTAFNMKQAGETAVQTQIKEGETAMRNAITNNVVSNIKIDEGASAGQILRSIREQVEAVLPKDSKSSLKTEIIKEIEQKINENLDKTIKAIKEESKKKD